ncbi:hypothetical protein SABIM44S_02883 [Streptomyces abikoensis]
MPEVKEFRLPDLGEGLTEAEVVRWLVEVGEVVAVDQPVVEVETAKAMVEVPCPYGGVVTARFGEEGAEIPVGAPLLTVAVGAGPVDASASTGEEPEASGNVLVGYGTGAPAARRRRVRPQAGPSGGPGGTSGAGPASGGSPEPAGPEAGGHRRSPSRGPGAAAAGGVARGTGDSAGREASRGVREERRGAAAGPVPVVSPLVRKLAREHGLDLRALTGTGRDGLILRADVERAVHAAADADRAPAPPRPPEPPGPSASPCGGCAVLLLRSSAGAAGRSPTPPAGWTPMRPSSWPRARP